MGFEKLGMRQEKKIKKQHIKQRYGNKNGTR